MKIKTILILGLLAFSGIAFGQDTKADGNSANSVKPDPFAMQGSAPQEWAMAKGHEKGYLVMNDAQANSWLAQNFKACDADGDGKVTEAEYTQCQKAKVR